jgi:hypothetical protein
LEITRLAFRPSGAISRSGEAIGWAISFAVTFVIFTPPAVFIYFTFPAQGPHASRFWGIKAIDDA